MVTYWGKTEMSVFFFFFNSDHVPDRIAIPTYTYGLECLRGKCVVESTITKTLFRSQLQIEDSSIVVHALSPSDAKGFRDGTKYLGVDLPEWASARRQPNSGGLTLRAAARLQDCPRSWMDSTPSPGPSSSARFGAPVAAKKLQKSYWIFQDSDV